MTRAGVAIALGVLSMVGLLAVQWLVTTPRRVTDTEWHIMLLSSIPAFTIVLSAYWVEGGRR